MYEGMIAETVRMKGHNGDEIDAYLARPLGPGPFGTVVLIHHMPGWDAASKEMVRKLAANGFATISPDMHYRQRQVVGTSASHEQVSTYVREQGGMPDDRSIGDVQGAINYLNSLPYSNGKVGVIGFCSGGRQTFLVACKLSGFSAAVDCWGGGVVAGGEDPTTAMPVAPINFTSELGCPLLGLFGEEDTRPSPAHVAEQEAELKRLNKDFEFHMYADAGHGFFAVDRPSYRQVAATEGWEKVIEFYSKHLGGVGATAGRAAVTA